jgi:type I restriction enzyme S subunit
MRSTAWEEAGLLDVADSLDSRRIPVNRTERDRRPGPVPYYGATGQVGWIDRPIFDEELCLLGEDGAPFLDRSKSKAYVIDGPCWVNNHAHVLRARADITSNRFLKYALDHVDYAPFVNGTTRLKLTKRAMMGIRIPLPPRAEQDRIVATIEEHFSRLDAGCQLLERARKQLAGLRDAVADRAFAREWPLTSAETLAEVQGGIQKQPRRRPVKNTAPFLRVANVLRGRFDLVEVHEVELFDGELERYRLIRGDLLVVEGNGSVEQIGRSAMWRAEIENCVHQNHLIRVRPGAKLVPEFLDAYWNSRATRRRLAEVASSTSGLYTLSTAKVKAIPVPIVPLDEQRAIVENLEREQSVIDALSASVDAAAHRAAALRRSILAQAFAGRLVSPG